MAAVGDAAPELKRARIGRSSSSPVPGAAPLPAHRVLLVTSNVGSVFELVRVSPGCDWWSSSVSLLILPLLLQPKSLEANWINEFAKVKTTSISAPTHAAHTTHFLPCAGCRE